MDDMTESGTFQSSQPETEAYRRNGKAELAGV